MNTMTLNQFAYLVVEIKQTSYEQEKEYVFGALRKRFNELINFSARYVEGRKVIAFDKVAPLKLSFRKTSDNWVSYNVAFSRFIEKCRNEKYAKQIGVKPLNYSHNTYI